MGAMKTPGVYIVEANAFSNSVVEVATAVPAFIGYTEKADHQGKSLRNKPWRITSMAEFEDCFGGAPVPEFDLTAPAPESLNDCTLTQTRGNYLLYNSMRLFYQNGGGPCYVVAVGGYPTDTASPEPALDPECFKQALTESLVKEPEPTMIVVPDAVLLAEKECSAVQQAALVHCGQTMRNRVAILDIHNGFRPRTDAAGDPVQAFRDGVGTNHLSYGMAYYPWLNTTLIHERDLSFAHLSAAGKAVLKTWLEAEVEAELKKAGLTVADLAQPANKGAKDQYDVKMSEIAQIVNQALPVADKALLGQTLSAMSPAYKGLLTTMAAKLNVLPPSAAMAGVYTMVDNNRGVWKAPANVDLNAVTSPTVSISIGDQEDLNITPQGKSINAIRSFVGQGVLVWGARTLDGNSLDWRYINVRRTAIMLEESIRLATQSHVFEPNVANTWVRVKRMIRNFLTDIWKQGGLAGTDPDSAFSVSVGLGETMTPEDILEGIMRVTVLVALVRPAEFIEITFQQQMQGS